MNGAVQGEATTTAKTPVKNDSRDSFFTCAKEPKLPKLDPKTKLLMNMKPNATNK